MIRAHNDQPYHFEKKNQAPSFKAYNPICGDKFELYVDGTEGMLRDIHFHGFGCAISKASTSILVKSLEGKRYDEALRLCDDFLNFVSHGSGNGKLELKEEFIPFSAIHEFPERLECATLAWTEMRKFLESKSKK